MFDLSGQTRALLELQLAVHARMRDEEATALRAENERLCRTVASLEAELAQTLGGNAASPLGSVAEASCRSRGPVPASLEDCASVVVGPTPGRAPGAEQSQSDASVLSISPCSSVLSVRSQASLTSVAGGDRMSSTLRQRLVEAEQAHKKLQRENQLTLMLSEKEEQIRRLKGEHNPIIPARDRGPARDRYCAVCDVELYCSMLSVSVFSLSRGRKLTELLSSQGSPPGGPAQGRAA
jgi:hypothetical protein